MDYLLENLGYLGLFVQTFLASTVLPLSSEAFVVLFAITGYDKLSVLIVATAGNFLGAMANYYLGMKSSKFVYKYFSLDSPQIVRAKTYVHKWGTPILFFSWVPILGDPLTIVAGLLKIDIRIYAFLVLSGRFLRYLFLIGLF